MAKITITFYSMYGHIRELADGLAGATPSTGHEATLLQVPEILSEEILKALHAPAKKIIYAVS